MSYNPYFRPIPLTENGNSVRAKAINESVNGLNIIAGKGLNVTYTANGIRIDLATDYKQDNYMVWAGDYNFAASYTPGQVIRVRYDTVYTNQNGTIIPFGQTSQPTGSMPYLSIGLFVCVNPVPPSYMTPSFVGSNVLPQYSGVVPIGIANTCRWYNFNSYYPMFPEIPTKYTSSVAAVDSTVGSIMGSQTIVANNTFWQALPIGGLPGSSCINNQKSTQYLLGALSGSVFDTSNLPYPLP